VLLPPATVPNEFEIVVDARSPVEMVTWLEAVLVMPVVEPSVEENRLVATGLLACRWRVLWGAAGWFAEFGLVGLEGKLDEETCGLVWVAWVCAGTWAGPA
jgi:hypothetical protein